MVLRWSGAESDVGVYMAGLLLIPEVLWICDPLYVEV